MLLIEKNSHFQHLFAFPRYAVATGVDTHKAFIPLSPGTFAECPPNSGSVIQAQATGISGNAVHLDRKVSLDGAEVDSIPYSYLVRPHDLFYWYKLTPPGNRNWYQTVSAFIFAWIGQVRWSGILAEARPESQTKLQNCHHWRRCGWSPDGY